MWHYNSTIDLHTMGACARVCVSMLVVESIAVGMVYRASCLTPSLNRLAVYAFALPDLRPILPYLTMASAISETRVSESMTTAHRILPVASFSDSLSCVVPRRSVIVNMSWPTQALANHFSQGFKVKNQVHHVYVDFRKHHMQFLTSAPNFREGPTSTNLRASDIEDSQTVNSCDGVLLCE